MNEGWGRVGKDGFEKFRAVVVCGRGILPRI